MSDRVSALILHFRNSISTQRCLTGLFENGIDRTQIVDNSEDGGKSLNELGPALRNFREMGMRIAILQPRTNLGFAVGVNSGIEAIRENFGIGYVLLINSDAQLLSGSLRKLINRARTLPKFAAVAPMIVHPEGTQSSWIYYHRLLGLILRRHLPGSFPYLSGCCLLLTPELATMRIFNPRFFFYGDDVDFGYRALMGDVWLDVVEDASVLHQGSEASRKGSIFYEYHISRSHLELARTLTHSVLDRVLAIGGRLITLSLRALMRSLRFSSWIPLKGLLLAWDDYFRMRTRTLTPK